MENKESRRTHMTKMLLKTALIELMQEKPFRQITIKELCERADLNRTTGRCLRLYSQIILMMNSR